MNLTDLLVKACLLLAHFGVDARHPNIYQARELEKNAGSRLPVSGGQQKQPVGKVPAPTFQRQNKPVGAAAAAAGPGKAPGTPTNNNPRAAGQPFAGYRAMVLSSVQTIGGARPTTIGSQVDWPWSGTGQGAGGQHQPGPTPQVLVATVMTTVTKFSVLTSTVTNNFIELLTETETETETLTRHSTRTVQVVSTQISKFTTTRTTTETETTTEYSLVPYTITEVETTTETYENVILTTFTMPATTVQKTLWSTITQPASTLTVQEYLQPLIETIATETLVYTETATLQPTIVQTIVYAVGQQKFDIDGAYLGDLEGDEEIVTFFEEEEDVDDDVEGGALFELSEVDPTEPTVGDSEPTVGEITTEQFAVAEEDTVVEPLTVDAVEQLTASGEEPTVGTIDDEEMVEEELSYPEPPLSEPVSATSPIMVPLFPGLGVKTPTRIY